MLAVPSAGMYEERFSDLGRSLRPRLAFKGFWLNMFLHVYIYIYICLHPKPRLFDSLQHTRFQKPKGD